MSDKIKILIKKIEGTDDLPLPKYMTKQSAGMDLYANIKSEEIIKKGEIKVIPTGIAIQLIKGYEAQVRPRSGLAYKYGIGIVNSPGTIDADYRGEIKIIIINFGNEDFTVKRGDRIAQMVVNKIETVKWIPVDRLDSSERGSRGFGHTGS